MWPRPLCHRAQQLWEADHGEFNCAYNTLPGQCWTVGNHRDHLVGKRSLRWGKAGAGLGVAGPATKPALWDSQTLGHSGSSESQDWSHGL